MYKIEISDKLSKKLRKLLKKDSVMYSAIINKIEEVRLNPERYKNLNAPKNNLKRVHVGSFVLLFSVNENTKTIVLEYFEHHDDAY